MSRELPNARHVIYLSLFVGLVVTVWPLPAMIRPFWPLWFGLIVIYWAMATPLRVSVGIAWTGGLLLDVLQGALLGENALALMILALMTRHWHLRLRVFPLAQQMLAVFFLITVTQLIIYWIRGIAGTGIPLSQVFWPAISSMLAWPWVFVMLRELRRRYQVN